MRAFSLCALILLLTPGCKSDKPAPPNDVATPTPAATDSGDDAPKSTDSPKATPAPEEPTEPTEPTEPPSHRLQIFEYECMCFQCDFAESQSIKVNIITVSKCRLYRRRFLRLRRNAIQHFPEFWSETDPQARNRQNSVRCCLTFEKNPANFLSSPVKSSNHVC